MNLFARLTALALLAPIAAFSQQKYEGNYDVLLANGTMHIEANTWDAFALSEEVVNGRIYRLMQFESIPDAEERKTLELNNVRFLGYLPHKTYIVSLPQNFNLAALNPNRVRSIAQFPAQFKIAKSLKETPYPAWAVTGNEVDITLQYYKDIDHAYMRETLAAQGITIIYDNDYSHYFQLRVEPLMVQVLAARPFTRHLEIAPDPGEPESVLGRSHHRSNAIDVSYPGGRQFDGTGVSVAINDDGFAGPHIDFTGRTDQTDVAGDFTGDHGDMTVGIVGGAGNLDPTVPGMAPGAFLWVRQYDSNLPNTLSLFNNDQVMVFSSSYSNGCNAGYTSLTEMVDEEIYDNPTLLQVFSAGNSNNSDCGYGAGDQWGNVTGGHKIGKNVIATANLTDDEGLVNSSSRGPASDGRIKPDIAANGQGQMSTDPNNAYAPGGGTSAACPGITGITAQLIQAFREMNGNADPESSLIKAAMLNTAYDLGNTGPDFSYGWGRVNAYRTLLTLEENRYLNASVDQGNSNVHNITVPAGVEQVRIMLYWMDPEGSTSASFALVNDLDLTVEDPSTTTHLPWLLDHTPNAVNLSTPAGNGVDGLNNMEQVAINTPTAGTYNVTVNGASVPSGPQSYYIVHEFLTSEITVTYPIGGEGLVPGETERIRWDAFGNTGTFAIDYSTDNGGTWTNATPSVSGSVREWNWSVPSTVTGQALMRVTRGADVDESDANFTIVGVPQNLNVDWICPDSLQFSWNPVSGATTYEVSMLGAMYMDSVGTTAADSIVLYGLNPNLDDWLSVKALGPNGIIGRRAVAVPKPLGVLACAIPTDVSVSEVLVPVLGTVFDCHDLSNVNVTVRIENIGTTTLSNIPVNYAIDAAATVTETFTGTLSPGADTVYTFTATEDLSAAGNYDIESWTSMAGDGNPYNDSIVFVATSAVGTVVTLPYSQDFETFSFCGTDNDCGDTDCSAGGGWKNEVNNVMDDIDFRTDNNGTASGSTGPDVDHNPGNTVGRYMYTEASGGCTFREALLLTPCIDLTNNIAPQFSFWYHMFGDDMGELHVDILSDGIWTLDAMTSISGDQGDLWRNAIIDLSPYAGKMITVRFRGLTGSDYQSDLAIDDINAYDINAITEEELIANSIQLYPNPTSSNTNFEVNLLEKRGGTLEIYNTVGKLISNYPLKKGVNNIEILSGNYASGLYYITVKTEETAVATKKLIVTR
jgi:hypothetical protein